MPSAIQVQPKDWSEITVLYDDGYYSVIWGRFRRRPFKNMGVRYNEGDKPGGIGYPSLGKYPLWYVEPPIMVEPILLGLQKKLQAGDVASATDVARATDTAESDPDSQRTFYLRNVEIALRQTRQQVDSIPASLGGE